MIGQYLETLSNEALDRVLTRKMSPVGYIGPHRVSGPSPCLVQTALGECGNSWIVHGPIGKVLPASYRWSGHWRHATAATQQYDHLCPRFGTERINAAIRDRALRVLAARVSLPAPLHGTPAVCDVA